MCCLYNTLSFHIPESISGLSNSSLICLTTHEPVLHNLSREALQSIIMWYIFLFDRNSPLLSLLFFPKVFITILLLFFQMYINKRVPAPEKKGRKPAVLLFLHGLHPVCKLSKEKITSSWFWVLLSKNMLCFSLCLCLYFSL